MLWQDQVLPLNLQHGSWDKQSRRDWSIFHVLNQRRDGIGWPFSVSLRTKKAGPTRSPINGRPQWLVSSKMTFQLAAGQLQQPMTLSYSGKGRGFLSFFRSRRFLTGISVLHGEGETHRCAIYLFIVVSFKFTGAQHARPVPLRPGV